MIWKILRRVGLCLLVTVLFLVVALYATLYNLAHGPSPTVRDILVQAAEQASATKWVPRLFFRQELIDDIILSGTFTDAVQIADLMPETPAPTAIPAMAVPSDTTPDSTPAPTPEPTPTPDPWENAIDGMILDTYMGSTFRAYVLLVKDPTRVYTAKTKGDFGDGTEGIRILDLAKDKSIIAMINAGSFFDPEGTGTGGLPLGITYSDGQCVWDDGAKMTFVGLDKDNRLIARNSMNRETADALGIRDGVCFGRNNVLIGSENGELTAYYSDGSASLSQRTAIGQKEDGTIILMVTDGRTAAYLGANRNDVINAMLSYGAVTAAMLDGGSSTVMYYRDYVEKYEIDSSNLSSYQKKGLVNSEQAIIQPRRLPTYFAVKSDE